MQTIETRYLAATNNKPQRVIARTNSDKPTRLVVSIHALGTNDDAERFKMVAQELARSMGWEGVMIGGHTSDGMIWVFSDGPSFVI